MFGEMAIDAVVAGVQLAADEPFPEGRTPRIQRSVPILFPMKQIGVFTKAFREILFFESIHKCLVDEISLADEARRGLNVLLFFPVNGDLRFVLGGLCACQWLRDRLLGDFL